MSVWGSLWTTPLLLCAWTVREALPGSVWCNNLNRLQRPPSSYNTRSKSHTPLWFLKHIQHFPSPGLNSWFCACNSINTCFLVLCPKLMSNVSRFNLHKSSFPSQSTGEENEPPGLVGCPWTHCPDALFSTEFQGLCWRLTATAFKLHSRVAAGACG